MINSCDSLFSTNIDEIGLTPRTCNALKRASVRRVADVFSLGINGLANVYQIGPKQHAEVIEAISTYLQVTPEEFHRLMKEAITNVLDGEISTSPELSASVEKFDEESISILGLSARAFNSLSSARITNIGELRKLPYSDLTKIRGLGDRSIREIMARLDNLIYSRLTHPIESLNEQPPFIEISYLEKINLLSLIVPLAESILKKLGQERLLEILYRRYGLRETRTYTLQEIGDFYGVSRERIRQLESKALSHISRLMKSLSAHSQWKVPEEIVREINIVIDELQSKGEILTENDLHCYFENRYESNYNRRNKPPFGFLMAILGFRELPLGSPQYIRNLGCLDTWITNNDFDNKPLLQAIAASDKLLRESVIPMPLFELVSKLNRKRKTKLSAALLISGLKVNPNVEHLPDGNYQIKFSRLLSLADRSFRILHEKNEPMYLRNITRQINHRLVLNGLSGTVPVRSVQQQLVNDQRFQPIGRSGLWGLMNWGDIRTDTIVDVIKEYFHRHQTSATPDEVIAYVQTVRPDASANSVRMYLSSRSSDFKRISMYEYELTEWGGAAYKPQPRQTDNVLNRLEEEIDKIFQTNDNDEMPYAKLVKLLMDKTGSPESTIRAAMKRSEILQLRKASYHSVAKIARYTGIKTASFSGSTTTKREQVHDRILTLLELNGGQMSVAELVSQITDSFRYNKQTVYAYLSTAPTVKKKKINKQLYCYLEGFDKSHRNDSVSWNSLAVNDVELRSQINRAVRNLTFENVDLGLFELGKILEAELKKLLIVIQEQDIFPVSRKDTNRLVDMMDFVERHGIVTNKHHLTFLRQERNQRAHEAPPTESERHRLLKQAPFLAGLFIDYIVSFHTYRVSLSK